MDDFVFFQCTLPRKHSIVKHKNILLFVIEFVVIFVSDVVFVFMLIKSLVTTLHFIMFFSALLMQNGS